MLNRVSRGAPGSSAFPPAHELTARDRPKLSMYRVSICKLSRRFAASNGQLGLFRYSSQTSMGSVFGVKFSRDEHENLLNRRENGVKRGRLASGRHVRPTRSAWPVEWRVGLGVFCSSRGLNLGGQTARLNQPLLQFSMVRPSSALNLNLISSTVQPERRVVAR